MKMFDKNMKSILGFLLMMGFLAQCASLSSNGSSGDCDDTDSCVSDDGRTIRSLSGLTADDVALTEDAACAVLSERIQDYHVNYLHRYLEDAQTDYCSPSVMMEDGASADSTSSSSSSSTSYTPQNSQVAGVLEPDTVFTNGEIIVTLEYDAMQIYRAWPVSSAGHVATIDDELSELPDATLTYYGMILSDDSLFAFARVSVDDADDYQAILEFDVSDPENPTTQTLKRIDGADYYSSGVQARLNSTRLVDVENVTYSAADLGYDLWPDYEDYEDIEPCDSNDEVTSEFQNVLTTHAEEQETLIRAWSIADNLPSVTTVDLTTGDTLNTHEISCSEILNSAYVAGPNLSVIVNANADRFEIADDVKVVMSSSQNIYMNDSVLILASGFKADSYKIIDDDVHEITTSALHLFNLGTENEMELTYQASGVVKGLVPSPWAIDENQGVIRVVTEVAVNEDDDETWWGSDETPDDVELAVLSQNGSHLETVGSVSAEISDEEVFAVRYVEEKAYIVTYDVVEYWDPLFVVDTSDTTTPTFLGSLEMPGYSGYLQMIDDGILLGLGQYDATCYSSEFCIGDDVKVSLYDVSDATLPTESDQLLIETGYYSSFGDFNHLAVHYETDSQTLYLPHQSYDDNGDAESSVAVISLANNDITTEQTLSVSSDIDNVERTILFSEVGSNSILMVVGASGIQAFDSVTGESQGIFEGPESGWVEIEGE